ncbi:unnamed protein product [Rotaria sp. Silwood1]|nr:unnamed protein product [Rotaria sp. Silwood1]CAF3632174.1 unnamed protein product [Rotaria sp. Silwood1]CAF3670025.1 unnamed protein product [Rotaria sp. Silwood1]CAF5003308.1 unnamed protein product [Rotaria sp. Silwood1]CAF5045450.1 unnamed protein product [Rotaria sp. Silwood1]
MSGDEQDEYDERPETDEDEDNNEDSTRSDGKSNNWEQEALEAHNEFRAHHGVPPMVLDQRISRKAQAYADYLAANNLLEHSTNRDGLGENLYTQSSTQSLRNEHLGEIATKSWYDEIEDYDFDNPGYSSGTGHFTQVIWKQSTKLGVGVGFSNNGRQVVVVCQYGPEGNMEGEFEENVPPPE